ncbi:MAG: CarD family transcriptional regulator [Firmicutes bacterium]|nr:CarD family transcriptional regulator [Bacillota bacterium]
MYAIGEKIVYPVHGAGIIEAVETREILGELRDYYVLRMCVGDMQVLVPVDSVEAVGVRPVSDMPMLQQMRGVLKEAPTPWEENWNKRYRLNMDKIKSGDICQVAEVFRNLMLRDHAKGLSAGEKRMLDNARKILVSEVVLVEGSDAEAVTAELNGIFA